MDTRELVRQIEFEWHATLAANPEWDTSLWDYLVARGINPDDIWEYAPQAGIDADQPEPDWM